ncbi:MAG TPA: regulatory iron-sulfur-containing complex subunit RicT [Kofleriaceae bacterium]|nr:regulatory iron-sulfur-containing complex subunit RicT [Kofleriaceae bacterium]
MRGGRERRPDSEARGVRERRPTSEARPARERQPDSEPRPARERRPSPETRNLRQRRPTSETRDLRQRRPEPEPRAADDNAPAPPLSLAPDLPRNPPADDPDPTTAHLDGPGSSPAGEGPGSAAEDADAPFAPIASVAGIKFSATGRVYPYDAGDASFAAGEQVLVDGDRGPRLGIVAVAPVRKPFKGRLHRILRRPSPGDQSAAARGDAAAAELLGAAKTRARELGLPIKLFRAEPALRKNKVVLYFSSEDKIDIRELCRDLQSVLRTRVEVRQTGVRDEAKIVGGIGSCGQELCCSTWLPSFVPVSIKMAKDQGMVLNPTKVAGQCGRLKCCLVYEQETYVELKKGMPKLGKRVITEDGEGRVVELDVLRRRVRVQIGPGEHKTYAADEVKPMFPSKRP